MSTQKNKPNHGVYKFQLILVKIPNLHIVWTEKKNLSIPDLLSRSLTTTTQDEHRLKTVEIPESIKFFMTHNQNTKPMQCHYAVSKEYNNPVSTNTTVESPHFSINLQIKVNYFKVELENDLSPAVSYQEFQTKAQPLGQIQQNKTQTRVNNLLASDTYPIIQHTDVTLKINRTEPYTQSTKIADYAELLNQIQFSLPAMDDVIPIITKIYN